MEEELRRRFFPDKTLGQTVMPNEYETHEERREAAPAPTKYTYRTEMQSEPSLSVQSPERKPSFYERVKGGFKRTGERIHQNIQEKIEFERKKKQIYKEAYREHALEATKVRAEREAYREALGSRERGGGNKIARGITRLADDFGSMRSSRNSPFSLGGESRRERGGFGMTTDHIRLFDAPQAQPQPRRYRYRRYRIREPHEARRQQSGFGMNLSHLSLFDRPMGNANRYAFKTKVMKRKRRYFNNDVLNL